MQQLQSNQQTLYRVYNRTTIILLDCLCIIGLVLFFVFIILSSILNPNSSTATINSWLLAPSQFGLLLLFGEIIYVMLQDWRGAITLRSSSKGYTFRKGKKVSTTSGFVLLYIFFPYIMLPIYLVRLTSDYQRMKHLNIQRQKHKIASLEAELGIMPPVDGTCRACKKPLVVGAEYCQYCGTTVRERPKICPSCATTASPDARWCPKCRTPLS